MPAILKTASLQGYDHRAVIIAGWGAIITTVIILKAVRPRDNFIWEFKYYLLPSMNNENKLDRIGVRLQNESFNYFIRKQILSRV